MFTVLIRCQQSTLLPFFFLLIFYAKLIDKFCLMQIFAFSIYGQMIYFLAFIYLLFNHSYNTEGTNISHRDNYKYCGKRFDVFLKHRCLTSAMS